MDISKMSSTSAEKNPKKRRIDGSKESAPGPSSEALPLVAPQLFRRSSKDPNRGMYPRGRDKSNQDHVACPQFIKASDLYKQSVSKSKDPKSKMTDFKTNSSYHKNMQESTSSDTQSTDSKVDDDFVEIRKRFNYGMKGKRTKAGFSRTIVAHKITKYFKSSPIKNSKDILKAVSRPSVASGWLNKDQELAQCLASNERFYQIFNKSYGLLQNSVKEGDGVNYFHKLPNHIIETILCQIPILDLTTCRLVCSRWKEIIDNEIFMEWKKLYYKYKNESCSSNLSAQDYLQWFIQSLGHTSVIDCIETLVKYMGKDFSRRPSSDMYSLLLKNQLGKLADDVLSERFPEWNGKESRVWCQFTIAIIISETVWDVLDVYLSLFENNSSCSRPDVMNAMYCIATFLLYYRNVDHINYGLHYRVYYALYLIENYIPSEQKEKLKIVKGLPGQQSIYSYSNNENSNAHLTYEQIRVLNHRFELNQKIRIIALAGTGKTTTLLHLARLYPQIKFLNLVFNKAVSDEAKKKFPPNVTCQTAHSLAYSCTGRFLRHKLTTKVRPYELIPYLKNTVGNIYAYANLVLTTINSFIVSTDTEMAINHVPSENSIDRKHADISREVIWKDACLIWEKMINKDDLSIKITHDVYLKLYHLKKPKLYKYQCILVDEAQDCNPAMLDIVLSQNVPVVLVGDPYQQIYGFRGAQNALQSVTATHTYYLTKSFRFGPEIAYIASCILEFLIKSSRRNTIIGSTHDSFINGHTLGQYAVIARTNMKLFNEALRMVVFRDLKYNEPSTVNAAFAGGIKSYGFDQLIDICKLRGSSSIKDKAITDKFVSKFKTFSDLNNYARHAEDADLMTKIELVNQHGSDILKFVSILKEKCSHPMELANVVFTTAHKAKGLEFDTVYLTDDYSMNFESVERNIQEDANILYVAITRAKKSLILPEKITKTLLAAHEKFEYPVSSKIALGDKTELKCIHCGTIFTPHTVLLMMRRRVVLASGREIPEGPFCTKCGSDPYMRPDVHVNHVIMYLDPTRDNTHQFMNKISGALPTDPPLIYDNFSQFQNHDRVFVINVNLH